MAEYLFTVSDKKLRSMLTRYRLSGHKLMIETGRHRQTWLPPEQRLCSHCDLNQMETELHFLTECSKYTDIRTVFYDKIQQIHPTFTTLPDQEKLAYLLGEHKTCCVFAAQYVSLCHHRRCPELMFPAHVDYIMTYYPIILLKCIFCLCKTYTVLYLILFLSHTYNSHSFCTTYLIRLKKLFYYYYYLYFLFLLIQMCTTCEQPSCNCFGNTNV